MINSIYFIDGSRPVLGDRPDRRATLGVISLSTAVEQPFIGILCSRWPGRCSGSALELPPRLDLHRHQRRDVRRLHLAVRRSWAPPSRHRAAVLGVPIIDRSGSSSAPAGGTLGSRPIAATSTTGCSTSACPTPNRAVIYGI